MKKKVLAVFLVFLFFMTVCTVLSKGIYKAQLARVKVCHPEKKSITHEINGVGSIVPGREAGVYTVENMRVAIIYVQKGDRVAEGDALFAVDGEDMAEQIRELEEEIRYLRAQINDIVGEQKEQARKQEAETARLAEDYVGLVNEYDLRIKQQQLSVDTAWLHMQDNAVPEEVEEQEAREGQEVQKTQEQTLASSTVSGSDITGQQETTDQQSETEKQEERKKQQLAADLLRVEYEKAVNNLEEVKLQKESAIKEWERRLEDAGSIGFQGQAQTVRLKGELALQEAKLEKWRSLQEAEGIVYAPENGVILETALRIGERTGDNACLLYAALEDSEEVRIPVEEQDGNFLSIGDLVYLRYKTLQGENKKAQGMVSYIEQRDGNKILHVRMEGAEAAPLPGQTVYMDSTVKSEVYDMVFPRSAVFGDPISGYYVYVVEQREGILGIEESVRRIPVTVSEKNENFCAVQSMALQTESEVVYDSSKALAEDNAVRVMGAEDPL